MSWTSSVSLLEVQLPPRPVHDHVGTQLPADEENASSNQGSVTPATADEAAAADTTVPVLSRSVSGVREIYKNSWLKQIPCTDKWADRLYKSQKAEKFWVVFCVHDEKEAFLEFYENRRSAYSHSPLTSADLSQCLHISPTIMVQDNDYEFVVTLETHVIRLAASTREQMEEWMDTLRNKLRELNVLEPKDNLYSKEPIAGSRMSPLSYLQETVPESQQSEDAVSHSEMSLSRLSLRDPNSPLPPVPATAVTLSSSRELSSSTNSLVFIRNPSLMQSASNLVPVQLAVAHENPVTEQLVENSTRAPVTERSRGRADSSSPHRRANSSLSSFAQSSSQSVPNTPITKSESCIYEPLFHMTSVEQNQSFSGLAIRNPNYENPPEPLRQQSMETAPTLPPKMNSESRRLDLLSSGGRPVRDQESGSHSPLHRALETSQSTPIHNSARQFHPEPSSSSSPSSSNRSVINADDEFVSANSRRRNSQSHETSVAIDESGRVLSLRESQVLKLQTEILHKSGVRLVLRKKDSINAIAFVESFNSVWIAGWKQKDHPLLHNTFHIGDRVSSISGHRVHSVQEVLRLIKLQHTIVDFVVCRTPCAKVLAIKREYEGQDLGLVREGGTAEIKEVRAGSLTVRHGLPPKAPLMDGNGTCNWVLTEINHRPLNLFFKDNEVQDRLNAIGLEISILVQPSELVKALKKQLKTLRGYKEYILQ